MRADIILFVFPLFSFFFYIIIYASPSGAGLVVSWGLVLDVSIGKEYVSGLLHSSRKSRGISLLEKTCVSSHLLIR